MNKKLAIVYKKAFDNKPLLDSILLEVSKATGAKAISNLKDPKTTLKKVGEKQEESPDRHYTLDDVNDVARGRLVYGTLKEMYRGVQALKTDLERRDQVQVVKTDDFFKHPEDGYTGYHIDLMFPNGQHSEIQLHTVNSYAATLATHPIHARADHEQMTDQDKAKNQAINDRINKLNPNQAAQIALLLDAKNQPAQAKAQLSALQTGLQGQQAASEGQQTNVNLGGQNGA